MSSEVRSGPSVQWQSADTLPRRKGWYVVRRVDSPEKLMCRPYGNGVWWTPLPDGWLFRMEPRGIYEWRKGSVMPVEPAGSKLTPIEERDRAHARAGVPV